MFCHHQHASNFEIGKSEVVGISGDADQAIGPELARLGYVVIAPDAIGFEERNWSFPTGRAQYFELATRLVNAKNAFPDTQLKCKVWEGGHVFTKEMREAAYLFLSQKL